MSRSRLAILRIFTWFHLFGVPAIISATNTISHLPKPTGRVTLFSFERGHLRTITDTVDTEVVLSMAPRYFEAYLFECNATFPVQWAYIGEGAPVVTADVGRFFRDFYDVGSYTYQSILLMYSLQELQSGRYICRGASKEHDKLSVHYDVYVPGNGTQILLSTSEKKLFVPENKEHAYIPCGVSDSTAAVDLYRGNQWGTFYPVPVNGSITFNPRKGFKIKFKDFLDPWGTYLCVSASNKKRRKVHLIPESLKAKYDLINHVNGKIPVYFSYEYEYNRVVCCTGTNFIPKLQWAGCGSILDCQVKSACFEEDRCEQRLGNSGYNPTKWIDPGPLPQGCSGYRLRDDPNGDFGLFKCSTPGIAQYQPYLLNRGNIFLDFEKTPPSEMILTLQRISPEGPSYIGDELEFHCNSTRFYFSYGIRWGWEKHNGEIDFMDDSVVVRDKYSIRGHRRRTTFKIPHSDIKSIICFVPVVNSATEWRTVSLPVVIAAHDVNFIPHQNPAMPPSPPSNNVVDLDALTYHTDYDTPNHAPPVQQQQHNYLPQPEALHQEQPVDLQVYNGAKAPYQEYQAVVPSTSSEYQQNPHKNPNYYSYTHDSSVENAHHHLQPIPSNNIEPFSEPQTIDIFPPTGLGSTPSPNIIAISRSNKRSRSRSHVKPVPVSPKPDIYYDIAASDKDNSRDFGIYDTFEPKPSSSINANSRLQQHHSEITSKSYRPKGKSNLSPRMRDRDPLYSSPSSAPSASRGPPSTPAFRRQPNNYGDDERTHSTSRKSYRDYSNNNNYNEKHEISDEERLSLPFEPVPPSGRGGRFSGTHGGSNYSTIGSSSRDVLPLRVSSGSRSSSRRPSPTTAEPPHQHHYQSNSPSRHHRHRGRDHSEKDFAIDDTYSQHVRLSLPSNSISTLLPKLYKIGRSRERTPQPNHHGRSRNNSSPRSRSRDRDHPFGNHPRNPDYYYTSDDSPVEIKVPRTKSHEPYRHSRPTHVQYHQEITGSRSSNKNDHNNPPSHDEHYGKDEYYKERETSREPELHEQSATTYTRRPSQVEMYRRNRDKNPSPSGSSDSNVEDNSSINTERQRHYQQGRYHDREASASERDNPRRQNYRSSSSSGRGGRHRTSYSRGMKFSRESSASSTASAASPEASSGALDKSELGFEIASPSARPVYYVQPPSSPKQNIASVEILEGSSKQQHSSSSIELINNNANMELQKVTALPLLSSPSYIFSSSSEATTPTPIVFRKRPSGFSSAVSSSKQTNSSDILHSVSISISSRVTHNGESGGGSGGGGDDENDSHSQILGASPLILGSQYSMGDEITLIEEKSDNEAHESEDYDVYSPKYTNYKVTGNSKAPARSKQVPIQYFHVKPSGMSSFQPAKSISDEDDDDLKK